MVEYNSEIISELRLLWCRSDLALGLCSHVGFQALCLDLVVNLEILFSACKS